MDAKGQVKPKWMTTIALMILLVVAVVGGTVVYYGYIKTPEKVPAEILPLYEEVSLYFSNGRAETAVNPAITVKKGSDIRTGTASGGKLTLASVERGTWSVNAKLADYYELDTTQLVESTVDKPSYSFALDQMGTFSWGDTDTSHSVENDTNDQDLTINLYILNSEEDAVLKDIELTIVGTEDGVTIDTLECTTHVFSKEDTDDLEWEILLGDIEEGTPVTVTLKLQVDAGAATKTLKLACSVDDFRGAVKDYQVSKSSTTITITSA